MFVSVTLAGRHGARRSDAPGQRAHQQCPSPDRKVTAETQLRAAAPASSPVLAGAHHSGAMFDRTRVIEINGVVKEFLWTNPHSSFQVEVRNAQR